MWKSWRLAAMSALALMLVVAAFGEMPAVTTFTDKRDGKTYKKVTIGKQVWFARNLDYAAEGSVCYENSPDSCKKYGRLYDWETALAACPADTHLPSDYEWKMLNDFVGDEKTAGTKLKAKKGWERVKGTPTGTDNYGFSALPGGLGRGNGGFNDAGGFGIWWSAWEHVDNSGFPWYRSMSSYFEELYREDDHKTQQFSVRCVEDAN